MDLDHLETLLRAAQEEGLSDIYRYGDQTPAYDALMAYYEDFRPRRRAPITVVNEWLAGYAVALAEIHRLHEHSTGVCEVARNAGVTIATAKAAGVDEFDLSELRKAGVK